MKSVNNIQTKKRLALRKLGFLLLTWVLVGLASMVAYMHLV